MLSQVGLGLIGQSVADGMNNVCRLGIGEPQRLACGRTHASDASNGKGHAHGDEVRRSLRHRIAGGHGLNGLRRGH
ncbi:MAG: hypothetical protein Q8K85_01390, partial [Hyphomicrobium sp.]|nr:hypothetical protein [Hyphomicrobium sp.]